jgi:hypothetical protein
MVPSCTSHQPPATSHPYYTVRMRSLLTAGLIAVLFVTVSAQTRKPARRPPPPPPPPALETIVPEMICPTPLGMGVVTKRAFCDVMAGRDPAAGILIKLPPHTGPVKLSFDLHNRHTYSEEQARTPRAFARYTATVGVLMMDNTLIGRAVVQSEFRTAADLLDRVSGGAGPGGVKAVAPTGTEPITIEIPESENQVSILGEKLTVERFEGNATYTQPGRPVANISHVMIEYRPLPPPKATAKAPPKAPAAKPTSRGR